MLRAKTDFAASPLRELLRAPERSGPTTARARRPGGSGSREVYVVGVLALSAAGGSPAGGSRRDDLSRALSVTTAVLIVTCPCAFGIATPLAYEMVQAGLRRRGLFVRSGELPRPRARRSARRLRQDRDADDRRARCLTNPASPGRSARASRAARCTTWSARSSHPKSAADPRRAWAGRRDLDERARVVEQPGLRPRARARRTAPGGWATAGVACAAPRRARTETTSTSPSGVDGQCWVAGFRRRRAPAPGRRSARSRRSLRDGYDVWLLSGDAQAARRRRRGRVWRRPSSARSATQTPAAKARFLDDARRQRHPLRRRRRQRRAGPRSRVRGSGTPAIDRPLRPGARRLLLRHAGPRAHPPRPAQLSRARASRARRPRDRPRLQRRRRWPGARGADVAAGMRRADACQLTHHDRRHRRGAFPEESPVEVVILQVFVSLILVAGSVLLFAFTCRQRDFDHADRLALLPLDEETKEMSHDACDRAESARRRIRARRLETRRIVYNDWISRWFVGASVVWGIVGMLVGVLVALQLAWWQREPAAVPHLRAPAPAPHERGHLRVRRQHGLRGDLLLDAAPREGATAERFPGQGPLLGLAGDHRRRRHHASARLHPGQGVRGARVADRPRDRRHLGRLRHPVLLDPRAARPRSTSTSRSGSTSRRS